MRKSIHTVEYKAMCEVLRQIREEAGLSQRALASRLKVSPSWVAKVEMGERRVDVVEFLRFVRACGGDAEAAFSEVARRLKPPVQRRGRA